MTAAAVTPSAWRRGTAGRILIACALSALLLVTMRTAWVSDQAYMTIRTADQIRAGSGPRWNVDERVQVAAHPLWLGAMTAARAVTGEAYFSSLALGAGMSLLAAGLLLFRARTLVVAGLTATMLISSKAFVEYSTSGLENPLSAVLLVLAVPLVLGSYQSSRQVGALGVIGALALLTDPANGAWVAPFLIRAVRLTGWAVSLRVLAVAMSPLIAWLVFAQVYYGTVLPGPMVSWLFSGRSISECTAQGLAYLMNSLANDPVTLFTILLAIAVAWLRRVPGGVVVAAGLIASLATVVLVGGDGMSGRMMTGPFVLAVVFLSGQPPIAPSWAWGAPFLLVVGLGQLGSAYPVWSNSSFGPRPGEADLTPGIADARRTMYPDTGLLRWNAHTALLDPLPARAAAAVTGGKRVIVADTNAGTLAYYAGRHVHVIDRSGAADPLLARLPIERPWRPDRLSRALPPGYLQSLEDGANHLTDPSQARLYDDVRRLARMPLGAPGRWSAMKNLLADAWRHLF